ncbi:APC family permease [Maridesulfovibrio salexigens]|uniref:Amino acid permease-associated region n=1 Tax=Maridesulfovibrio salexigens (strain ATCC 14822 / DSM 2638 / NCIMB 8403 / VKM B-1763) TaxID=526222 RepID=C6BT89_MARSD|nr:APC family permease [Maridesulfovibrio salexigens]ACS81570.1 amino acid permease-associated region [Maridesulfovibrio salexigens DSM 2638]
MSQEKLELEKSMSPAQVWALALGSIVGWGCFVLPGDMFLPQAGILGTLIGFGVGAFLICFVAISYSYMIKYAPVAGGAFAYAYVGFGPSAAFVCGWALVLGYIAIIGIDVAALALIFRFLFPGVFEFGALYSIAGWQVYTGEVILMTFATLLFGWMNYRGNSFAGKFQVMLTFLLTLGIVSLFTGSASLETAEVGNLLPLFAEHRSMISCVLIIFAISPFLFAGFDTVPQAAEEFTFEPSYARNIMIIAILCGFVLYALVTLAVGVAIPVPEMLAKMDAMRAAGGTAWATGEVAAMAFGKLGAVVLACAVMGAVCTGINGFYIATSRLLLSMSRAGIMPSWFGDIHPKYRTPYKAILFTIAIVLLTPFAGRSVIVWIVDMSSVGTGIGYLFSCLAARRVILGSTGVDQRSLKLFCCGMGTLASVLCIVLLLIPGSPAYISEASRWCMVVWVAMGVFFYFSNRSAWAELPEVQMRRNVLGSDDIPVFYKGAAQGQPQTVSE